MLTFIVCAVLCLVSICGGAYAGYRYGRSVEAKVSAIVSAVRS